MLLEKLSPDEMSEVSLIYESSAKLGFNVLKKVYELCQTQKDNGARQQLLQYAQENPFVFRGNNQDLSWFWSRSELTIDKLTQLQEPLREQVLKNFGAMQQQGLVSFDGRTLTITAEGSRYIHDTGYIAEVVKADQALNQQIQNILGNTVEAQRFRPSTGAAVQATANTAQTATQAAGQTAAKSTAAASTAGIALAAQAAQEVVLKTNQAINQSMTHSK